MTALRDRSNQLKGKGGKQKPTQSEFEVILSLLKEESVDVKLAVLAFLHDHIDSTHMPVVFPLLDSEDASVVRATVKVIRTHRDTSGESLLLRKLDSPIPKGVRRAIVDALSHIGGDVTEDHCKAVLEAQGSDGQSSSEAFEILWGCSKEGLLETCLIEGVVQRLPTNDRIQLLVNLGNLEAEETRYDGEIRTAVTHILNTLRHDPDPRVCGRVAALWLRFGKKQYGQIVDREEGWKLLQDCGSEGLAAFVDGIGDESNSLTPEDGVRLVDLVKGDWFLEEQITWHLQHLTAPGVEDFMLGFAEPGHDVSVWAFAYFADRPTRKAAQACEKALSSTRAGMSEKVLAAICLAKLGEKAREGFIVENVSKAAVWIGVIARSVLEPLAKQKTKKGKAIRQILQKIPKSWPP